MESNHSNSSAAAAAAGAFAPARKPAGFNEHSVLPGDDVTDNVLSVAESLRLGNGLTQLGEGVVATKAGIICHKAPNRFYVTNNQRRYVPAVGDTVVGIVVDRTTDFYRVRLHGTGVAQLPILAFDGATKRNKPNLAVGASVFARVAVCNKHLDPELSCQAAGTGPKKDWMTGQSVYGELKGGTLVHVSTGLARRLLDPECAILTSIGSGVPFEIAVGLNGTVWVQAANGACEERADVAERHVLGGCCKREGCTAAVALAASRRDRLPVTYSLPSICLFYLCAVRHTVAICAAIEKSEFLTDDQARQLVDRVLRTVASGERQ